jgi:hypothetical protein
MEIFRPAYKAELRSVYEVFYQNELLDNPHLPLPGDVPPYLRHVLIWSASGLLHPPPFQNRT